MPQLQCIVCVSACGDDMVNGDEDCGNPKGMENNVGRFPWDGRNVGGLPRGWNKIVRDTSGTVGLFDFYRAPAAPKLAFKLD